MQQTPELTSDLIQETLGPDVQPDVWNGQIMPYDAVYQRRISEYRTRVYWYREHQDATDYHQQFRGYCPRCGEGN